MKNIFGFVLIPLVLFGGGCIPNETTSSLDNASRTAPSVSTFVTQLDLSGTGLKSVPSYVFQRTELKELNVSDNNLTGALQAEIHQLKNLQILKASGNEMTGVPAEIGQLSELREIDFSENKLTGLPSELGNLQNLRLLDLRGNMISKQDLDAIRARLTQVEILE